MPNLFAIRTDRQADALKERDGFLEAHPELKVLQRQIDERLRKASTGHNRLLVIHGLMMESFLELHLKLQSIVGRRSR
jgi:hypothetical protein